MLSPKLSYMIHHVFLPPKLPEDDDSNKISENFLLKTVIDAAQSFPLQGQTLQEDLKDIAGIVSGIQNTRANDSSIDEAKLCEALQNLSERGVLIALHIKAQNAGLLISKNGEKIIFESFEISPMNNAVMSTLGRLRRSFPRSACEIDLADFKREDFQISLSRTISKMSYQPAPNMQPLVEKAEELHGEPRDTANPAIVTECLMNFLSACGRPTRVSAISKNTREDVIWSNTQQPWRRSPLWLLIRVTLQLFCARRESTLPSRVSLYKAFMIYLMARILKSCLDAGYGCEMLFAMMLKIHRRLLKIRAPIPEPWYNEAKDVIMATHAHVRLAWERTIHSDNCTLDLAKLKPLQVEDDLTQMLPELDQYIGNIKAQTDKVGEKKFAPSRKLPYCEPDDLPFTTIGGDIFQLAAVELWVEQNLPAWIEKHLHNESTCRKFGDFMIKYRTYAVKCYADNPESLSIAILTILELWIASDKSACALHNLLSEYSPGIPLGMLEALTLPFGSQMLRLFSAEKYLMERQQKADSKNTSVFSDFGKPTSFAVRYFNQSAHHNDLRNAIESEATKSKAAKLVELRAAKAVYQNLLRAYSETTDCTCAAKKRPRLSRRLIQQSESACKKCSKRQEAYAMVINLHEWPLSSNDCVAKTTVFELSPPMAFCAWRDSTVFLILDVFKSEYTLKAWDYRYLLRTDANLTRWVDHAIESNRIVFASTTKSHIRTNRRQKHVGAVTEEEICVNNGCKYAYYDSHGDRYVSETQTSEQLVDLCSYKLWKDSAKMQKYLRRPPYIMFAPNEVLAAQSDCPKHVSLRHFKQFCNMPLGYHIQWQNVLSRLSMDDIDFSSEDVTILLLQIMNQTGPPDPVESRRIGHCIFADAEFGEILLQQIRDATEHIKKNWEALRALQNFTYLVTRILALVVSETQRRSCMEYLRTARDIAKTWITLLQSRIQETEIETQKKDMSKRLVDIALICLGTFDVEREFMKDLIDSVGAPIYIQCSIIVQEFSFSNAPYLRKLALLRWRRLSFRALPFLRKDVTDHNSRCLDIAIQKSWIQYEADCPWQVLDRPYDQWVSRRVSHSKDSASLDINYNLLTAKLLVNGLPVRKLPTDYTQHPLYKTLFGNASLQVMPTPISGMSFLIKQQYNGFYIHMGTHSKKETLTRDLLIRAIKGDCSWDLIPSRLLKGHFPTAFSDQFLHWYDHGTHTVTLSPTDQRWPDPSNQWQLTQCDGTWQLRMNETRVLGSNTKSAQIVSEIFAAIEDPPNVQVLFKEDTNSLHAILSRLQIDFEIDRYQCSVRSRRFRGMVLDTSQAVNTLIGLRSKLVLRPENDDGDRILLVPNGQLTYDKPAKHVIIEIDRVSTSNFHVYRIDSFLGRILDDGSLHSRLFLCRLHALSSSYLPDPLTKHTGTEQALKILNSAAMKSFSTLQKVEFDILDALARLAPIRRYYPPNQEIMQTVSWNPSLPTFAHHGAYYTYVKKILDHAERIKVCLPKEDIPLPDLRFLDSKLLERDLIRSSPFRISGFGAESSTPNCDVDYIARDRGQSNVPAFRAYSAALLAYERKPLLLKDPNPTMDSHLYNRMTECEIIKGTNLSQPATDLELSYDAEWLDGSNGLLQEWCNIHNCLRSSPTAYNRFDVMIWLSTLAYAKTSDEDLVSTLLGLYNLPAMRNFGPPDTKQYRLSTGTDPTFSAIEGIIGSARLPFESSIEAKSPSLAGESPLTAQARKKRKHQETQDLAVHKFARKIYSDWPIKAPRKPHDDYSQHIDVGKAMSSATSRFESCFRNREFHKYLSRVKDTAMHSKKGTVRELIWPLPDITSHLEVDRRYMNVNSMFQCAAPLSPTALKVLEIESQIEPMRTEDTSKLRGLLDKLAARAVAQFQKKYLEDLRSSLESLGNRMKMSILHNEDVPNKLEKHLTCCQSRVRFIHSAMEVAVRANARFDAALALDISNGPRLSPLFFLEQLSHTRWTSLARDWQDCLITYGLALTEVQRAKRLLATYSRLSDFEFEYANKGHTNWEPREYPESLLLEIENGLLIRQVQESIALHMRQNTREHNVVMQLNMGEGKSSVIVPIVAAAVANGECLVRVIVPKPQSKQMFEMLSSKLGGLLDRRIYHLPFSRAIKLEPSQAKTILDTCKDCIRQRGVLLVQPEHILSLKLMSIECMLTGNLSVAQELLRIQHLFDTCARDIVDESDENFSVNFELVYTMGTQGPIDLVPHRWNVIHHILGVIANSANDLQRFAFDRVIIQNDWPERVPKFKFLQRIGVDLLLNFVANHVQETGFPGFPAARQPPAARVAIGKYFTKPDLSAEEIDDVEKRSSFFNSSTKDILLLLRGLFACGVLSFALDSKRWRIHYGLDANRTPSTALAVPYKAKDSPTSQSEFSHPDVVIALTSFSYYHGGLRDDDLSNALRHLLQSEEGSLAYEAWVQTATNLPHHFQKISGINLEDIHQCKTELFPALRFSKGAIDYYLANFVFPREMRQFPKKLSASGWDIGSLKTYPMTGFSGTNDSRHLLPLTVQHLNLAEQNHTNALVLNCLLQDGNEVKVIPHTSGQTDAELLLQLVTSINPAVRVIIDVGAQILELDNLQVATAWLKMTERHENTNAVVFFNDSDELCVVDRMGRIELLQTSTFAYQLETCLVFLDEAHTRGTDLKLPSHYRAAVTLGANLTKDKLVQACMRMRKLGRGQTVVFCTPEEVRSKIINQQLSYGATLSVAAVLAYTISQTWSGLCRSMPLWAKQGQRFVKQDRVWRDARKSHVYDFSQSKTDVFLEHEALTVEKRYNPRRAEEISTSGSDNDLNLINQRCIEFDSLNLSIGTLEEEQERELSPEIQRERQVERPEPVRPALHSIHEDLQSFAKTGSFKADSDAFLPAFKSLLKSSAASHLDVSQFPDDLLVTEDFARTVQVSGRENMLDAYFRPVQWILTRTKTELGGTVMILISPFEADELLRVVRENQAVTLHLYTPRTALSQKPQDDLILFTQGAPFEPSCLSQTQKVLLNLFSGQLYWSSYQEYTETCKFLGLAWMPAEEDSMIDSDGFQLSSSNQSAFSQSPVPFLKVLMSQIRRDGEDVDRTHIGRMLFGGLLRESDFMATS